MEYEEGYSHIRLTKKRLFHEHNMWTEQDGSSIEVCLEFGRCYARTPAIMVGLSNSSSLPPGKSWGSTSNHTTLCNTENSIKKITYSDIKCIRKYAC
jgi:hypothetical protein